MRCFHAWYNQQLTHLCFDETDKRLGVKRRSFEIRSWLDLFSSDGSHALLCPLRLLPRGPLRPANYWRVPNSRQPCRRRSCCRSGLGQWPSCAREHCIPRSRKVASSIFTARRLVAAALLCPCISHTAAGFANHAPRCTSRDCMAAGGRRHPNHCMYCGRLSFGAWHNAPREISVARTP